MEISCGFSVVSCQFLFQKDKKSIGITAEQATINQQQATDLNTVPSPPENLSTSHPEYSFLLRRSSPQTNLNTGVKNAV